MKCKYCGEELEEGWQCCPVCGKDIIVGEILGDETISEGFIDFSKDNEKYQKELEEINKEIEFDEQIDEKVRKIEFYERKKEIRAKNKEIRDKLYKESVNELKEEKAKRHNDIYLKNISKMYNIDVDDLKNSGKKNDEKVSVESVVKEEQKVAIDEEKIIDDEGAKEEIKYICSLEDEKKKIESAKKEYLNQKNKYEKINNERDSKLIKADALYKKRDYVKAFELYDKYGQDDLLSQYKLGYMYECGKGVNEDINKAKFYYTKAIEQEHAEAMYRMYYIYLKEIGNEVYEKYFYLLEKAACLGLSCAAWSLGLLYCRDDETKHDLDKGISWMEYAASNKDEVFTDLMGDFYLEGKGIPKDINKAIYWYNESANNGSLVSMQTLFKLYSEGKEVPKDKKLAKYWQSEWKKALKLEKKKIKNAKKGK